MSDAARAPAAVDVAALIDEQRLRAPAIVFLVVATLAMIADGYDIAAMGYVVPELVKTWHVTPGDVVPAMSAGVFGLLFGAPIFGYVGDRFGRRTAILIALSLVGVLTLATAAARTLDALVVLRLLTGIGLGGLIPNVIALAAEMAPKRLRGLFIIIVNFGVPAGFILPGWVAAWLVPAFGWPALMIVGGLLPLAIAGAAGLLLGESISFLIARGGQDAKILRRLRQMRPDVTFAPGAVFAAAARTGPPRASPKTLFAGSLVAITPLLWIALAANQFANFFTLSWLPTMLQASGLGTAEAGISSSMYSVGGIVGGIVLTFLIDRLGGLPMVVLFTLGAPLVASIGATHPSPLILMLALAGAGFCVTGNNFAINAVVGMIYPTAVRSMGTGWAQAFGRLGSLAAQIIGGVLLARHLPIGEAYLAPALILLIGAGASVVFVVLCFRRFRTFRLDDASSTDRVNAAEGARALEAGSTAA